MKNTLIRQKDLDPTTGAQVDPKLNLPMVIKMDSCRNTLVISRECEIEIAKYEMVGGSAYAKIRNGNFEQIPLTDFISELEQLIAEVKLAHGLDAKVLEWNFLPEGEVAELKKDLCLGEIYNT